jgi:hypothetical protein
MYHDVNPTVHDTRARGFEKKKKAAFRVGHHGDRVRSARDGRKSSRA